VNIPCPQQHYMCISLSYFKLPMRDCLLCIKVTASEDAVIQRCVDWTEGQDDTDILEKEAVQKNDAVTHQQQAVDVSILY